MPFTPYEKEAENIVEEMIERGSLKPAPNGDVLLTRGYFRKYLKEIIASAERRGRNAALTDVLERGPKKNTHKYFCSCDRDDLHSFNSAITAFHDVIEKLRVK